MNFDKQYFLCFRNLSRKGHFIDDQGYKNTVETAKFGRHFCSDFSAELCSFRTWKILLSSDDMDELLSSDLMNELCNYELKSSDICSELLDFNSQFYGPAHNAMAIKSNHVIVLSHFS